MTVDFAKQLMIRAMGLQTLLSPKQQRPLRLVSKVVSDITDDDDDASGYVVPETLPNPVEAAYISWLTEHPSALRSFDWMMKTVKRKRIVVFLDYDGTLSPIVNDPDRAFMTDQMRAAIGEVSKYFPTAIISGRSRDKVRGFVQLQSVYYAGSHGMDIAAPSSRGNEEVLLQPAKKFLPSIQEIFAELEEKMMEFPGARVEDNRFCVSVHFRQVQDEQLSLLQETVKSVVEKYPGFHFSWGKKVMEIRPSIDWNKGHAVEYLLEALGFMDSSDVVPLYIGDDRTDEDAFEAIERRGQGFPIVVSSVPKETGARYSLCDPSEVQTFLLRLARWRKGSTFGKASAQVWGLGDGPEVKILDL